jgi:excinuclease UvrABC ATPase subunit
MPKRKITIFTGLSGSDESSIVFDTIATAPRIPQKRASMEFPVTSATEYRPE